MQPSLDKAEPAPAEDRARQPIKVPCPPFVVIVGMHRSGTSLCSHFLNALGVDMADTPAPHPSNPKGHWERPEIVALHDQIFGLFKRSYTKPMHDLRLPAEWWIDPRVGHIEREIISFLQQKNATSGPFGFKDPRTARLLPLWRRIFSKIEVSPKIVLCLRNPAQVARSLNARDELPLDLGEYRWFSYMADAFANLHDDQVCVIEYEDWFSAESRNPGKLMRFLDLEEPVSQDDLAAATSSVIDRTLRHDDSSGADIRQPLVRSLYGLARQMEIEPAARAEIGRMVAEFAAFQQLHRPIEAEFERLAGVATDLLKLQDQDYATLIPSWRHPAVEAAWSRLRSEATQATDLRLRMQIILKQRAELDGELARTQQDAALSRHAAETAQAELAALRRPIDMGKTPQPEGGIPAEPEPLPPPSSEPIELLARMRVPAGGTLASADSERLVDAILSERNPATVQRLTDLRPTDAEFSYSLSVRLLEADFPDHSERAARHAVAHAGGEAKYYERLASIMHLRGNRDGAIGMLQIACDLAGDWTYPRERLAELLAEGRR